LVALLVLPVIAKEDAPGLDRGPLSKITFIHYKKNFAKPSDVGKPKPSACYGFLGKGVQWKELPQSLFVNTTNDDGLSQAFITGTLNTSEETWNSAADIQLYSGYTVDNSANWDDSAPDGRNETSFASYPNEGVIAVTNIWGYFGGPVQTREIVEFDILFNNFYSWGDASDNPSLMDVQNIATHEMGHGWGLDDIYNTSCSTVTMYGYSDYGEISKRDLDTADITGIQSLY